MEAKQKGHKQTGERFSVNWIEETYKELLHDDGQGTPKQEALVEQVGKRGIVLQILGWAQGK